MFDSRSVLDNVFLGNRRTTSGLLARDLTAVTSLLATVSPVIETLSPPEDFISGDTVIQSEVDGGFHGWRFISKASMGPRISARVDWLVDQSVRTTWCAIPFVRSVSPFACVKKRGEREG